MDVQQTYHDLVRRDVFDMLPARLGTVLDFGGGIGATSACLKRERGAERVVLLDQVASGALPEIDQAEALDFDDHAGIAAALDRTGPFDTILALDVLEHLKDPWGTVALLDRALKPGGSLVVSVPNLSHYTVLGPLLFRNRFDYRDAGPLDRTHLRWFTKRSAIALATCSGLKLHSVGTDLGNLRNRLLNAATLGLANRFLTIQYKVRALKQSQ